METPVGQEIYRDGELIATPSDDQTSYTDDGLSPNKRYVYRLALDLGDGSPEIDEASAATLAYPPRVAGPMGLSERGFSLAIVDEMNPPETDYRVSVRRREEPDARSIRSEWDTSRCRTFDGLNPDTEYRFAVVARNLDGVETAPTRWVYNEIQEKPAFWRTQMRTGANDQWSADRINSAVDVYGLTERARMWMLSDIPLDLVRAGDSASPETIMHRTMDGFFENWTGFQEPCDSMNIYTFKRDVAQFMLDFRRYERSGEVNP